MDKSVSVTVIIPTFNRREWIGECLDSVLGQTHPNIEIIVVDDCSTDDTVAWLKEQNKYERVRLHVQEKNGGASVARNTGIEIAAGDLVVFIDSDDMLLPHHVEKAVAAFEQYPDLGLFCCDSQMIDVEGNVILDGKTWHAALSEAKRIRINTGFRPLEDVFRFSNCFPGFTLRREVFRKLGGFEQSIFPADDYDLALRVAGSRYKVFYLHEPLCLRREHDGQCSGIQNSVKTQLKLIEALENAVARNPESFGSRKPIDARFAEIKFDVGISQLKEGRALGGVKNVLASILFSPKQLRRIISMANRRIRDIAGASNS